MTDRYFGFVVGLASDIRSDDAEPILAAIRQIRGVVDVKPQTFDSAMMVAEMRARADYRERIFSVFEKEPR